jgi:hypothetical protein
MDRAVERERARTDANRHIERPHAELGRGLHHLGKAARLDSPRPWSDEHGLRAVEEEEAIAAAREYLAVLRVSGARRMAGQGVVALVQVEFHSVLPRVDVEQHRPVALAEDEHSAGIGDDPHVAPISRSKETLRSQRCATTSPPAASRRAVSVLSPSGARHTGASPVASLGAVTGGGGAAHAGVAIGAGGVGGGAAAVMATLVCTGALVCTGVLGGEHPANSARSKVRGITRPV